MADTLYQAAVLIIGTASLIVSYATLKRAIRCDREKIERRKKERRR